MIDTFLKHYIYEYCINTVFNGIAKNFLPVNKTTAPWVLQNFEDVDRFYRVHMVGWDFSGLFINNHNRMKHYLSGGIELPFMRDYDVESEMIKLMEIYKEERTIMREIGHIP